MQPTDLELMTEKANILAYELSRKIEEIAILQFQIRRLSENVSQED